MGFKVWNLEFIPFHSIPFISGANRGREGERERKILIVLLCIIGFEMVNKEVPISITCLVSTSLLSADVVGLMYQFFVCIKCSTCFLSKLYVFQPLNLETVTWFYLGCFLTLPSIIYTHLSEILASPVQHCFITSM